MGKNNCSGKPGTPGILNRLLGFFFIGTGIITFGGSIFYGKHFFVGDTEINLHDPLLIMSKTLGFLLLGFLFLGKGEKLVKKFSLFGEKTGIWLLTSLTAIIFVVFTLARYYACSMNAYDLTLFENSMYHISHLGDFYRCVNHRIHTFSDHLFLFLVPYSYLYRIVGLPGVLIVHKVLLSTVIPLAYLIAKSFTEDRERIGVALLLALHLIIV